MVQKFVIGYLAEMAQTKNTLTPPLALKRASYDRRVLEGAVGRNAGKGVNGGAVTGKRKRRKSN